MLNKKSKFDLLATLCSAILALASGVMLLFCKSLIGLGDSSITYLGIGAILAGIFALVSALILVCRAFIKSK